MNRLIKGLLIFSGCLLFGFGMDTNIHNAHASMPDPEYYHSTRYKDNVYYNVKFGNIYGKHQTKTYYGRMPSTMKQKHHIFALYYGHRFNKQFNSRKNAKQVSQPLYRRHQTYLPDYVYYAMPRTKVRIHNKKGVIYQLYINKRDIGKPYKNQVLASNHAKYFKSLKYLPVKYHYYRYKSYKVNKRRHAYRRYKKHSSYKKPKKLGPVAQLVNKAERLGKFPKSVTNQKLTNREIKHIRKENYITTHGVGSFKLHGEKADLAYQIITEMPEKGGVHSINNAELKYDIQTVKQDYKNQSPEVTVDSPFVYEGGSSATDPSTHSPSQVIKNCEREIGRQTLGYLNQDHASVGESNLTRYSDLDNIAQERSSQLVNDFNHYDSNGNPYVYDDGLSSDDWAENIAYTGGANFKLRTKNKLNRTGYNDDECQNIAKQFNQELFYDEEASDGGHYQNICNNYNVGIGVTIRGQMVYLAEDFD